RKKSASSSAKTCRSTRMRWEARSSRIRDDSITRPTSSRFNRTAGGGNVIKSAGPRARMRAWRSWNSMALLEMRSVTYVHRGRTLAGPVTLALEERGRLAYACGDAFAACAVSLIAAAIVKPSTGTVFIGAFDTRVQPVHSKRIAGYVQHEAGAHDFRSFTRYI